MIKGLPKEFGYYISSHNIEEAKIKVKKDNIQIIEINQKYTQYKVIIEEKK